MTLISENEATAMAAWMDLSVDFAVLNFSVVARLSGLQQSLVRRTVRALARKGMLEFVNCCWDDDGEMRGAGYQPTDRGWSYVTHAAELFYPSPSAGADRKEAA